MATITELASQIVAAQASKTTMTSEELLRTIQMVHNQLSRLDSGASVAEAPVEETKPGLTVKQAFKKNEVMCMVCGKGGFKTLARHLSKEHGMKPGEYRKQFGIPRTQPLTAKSFTESRQKMAEERGLKDVLAKARAARAAKMEEQGAAKKAPKKGKVPAKSKPAASPR